MFERVLLSLSLSLSLSPINTYTPNHTTHRYAIKVCPYYTTAQDMNVNF